MDGRDDIIGFLERVDTLGDRTAVRYRREGQWRDMSWRELGDGVRETALGLLALGVAPDETVGILSPNRPEWTIADLAARLIRAVPTPIDAAASAEQAADIARDAGVRFLFAGPGEALETARSARDQSKKGDIELIRLGPDGAEEEAPEPGMAALRERGRAGGDPAALEARMAEATGEDRATLVYTAGATGRPKGVVLKNRNIRFQMAAHRERFPPVGETDVSLCLLPLSHVFERMWTLHVLRRGGTVGYLDDPRDVLSALAAIRPTVMCAVPRFLEKAHQAVMARRAAGGRLRRALFDAAVKVGLLHHICERDRLRSQEPLALRLQFQMLDRLALKNIREALGGRMRFMACVGGAVSPDIDEFFFAAGLPLLCGYGLTETSGVAACRSTPRFKFGAAGHPLPGVELRIDPNTREVQMRPGDGMAAHHNRPEATAEAFTEDGYFRTGDAGEIETNGELRITGRLQERMNTAGGRHVAPQAVEGAISRDPLVDQVMIVADGREFVSALIVPAFESLAAWATQRRIPADDPAALVATPAVLDLFKGRLAQACARLAEHEKVKSFRLLDRPFTAEGGELTPLMEVRREVVAKRWAAEIEEMYGGREKNR
jgi:long-chain acyl-CoA synthetase